MVQGLIVMGVLLYIAFIVGIVIWANTRWKKSHAESQYKITDAEIFKLMTRNNHFLTEAQLVEASPLTKKEAKARLMHLTMQHVVTRFHTGVAGSVYQLKEEVPLINSLPAKIHNLSDKDIIDIMLMHVDDYQVTVAELVVIFGVDIYQAKALLKRLIKSGKLTVLRKSFEKIYAIKQPLGLKKPNIRTSPRKSELDKMPIPEQEKIKIPDAELIELALENQGKLTPTLLCLKRKIPINEAKIRLEELYEQGAFVMDIDEENYIMEYHLRDKSLLK